VITVRDVKLEYLRSHSFFVFSFGCNKEEFKRFPEAAA